MASKNGAFALELIPDVVASIEELVDSKHKKFRETAFATLSMLLRNFGRVIRDTTSSRVSSLGVNLSFEQRQEKCQSAKMSLQEMLPKLGKMEHGPGMHGRKARDLQRRIRDL